LGRDQVVRTKKKREEKYELLHRQRPNSQFYKYVRTGAINGRNRPGSTKAGSPPLQSTVSNLPE